MSTPPRGWWRGTDRGVLMMGGVGDAVAKSSHVAQKAVRFPQQGRGPREEAQPPAATPGPRAYHPFRDWCRRWGFHTEVALSVLAGLTAVLFADSHADVALIALGFWTGLSFHRGNRVTVPFLQQLRHAAQSVLLPLAGLATAVVFLSVPESMVMPATTAVVAAAATSVVVRVARTQLQSPLRVMLVGDRVAIAHAVARWMKSDRVHPVAALLVEPDLDEKPREIMGLPVVTDLGQAPLVVLRFRVDLVVVSPAPGLTSIDLRRLAWRLEATRAGLGVLGILDSVAPHRISPGLVEGATVNDVRAPRPSAGAALAKAAADRVAAALLLLLVAPLLLAMCLAVRLDSPGRALFTQTRVGRHGRHFKVYKMRTMVQDAEAVKLQLADQNEYDGILFKMKADPRITRVGALLRKTSLDELPQLLNVLRGEMSLVGPRPSLPTEVQAMDGDTLRRLAVKPGITGLWQVSGRSDLSWDEASALDTYYADNWSLTGDLSILVRTVGAVVGARGAY
ncbi:MAG TPA: exopolysaccharide biosynthesis polyprenyl glycosylphosphotransferase [Nocardioidaceae bacterium]|nr:exopolysaccharide biosynthesis polyprenyl glycosylphosphotransferase [Nocardioidaceae bacterium]